MKKIYIAGKVTGVPLQERIEKFNRAAMEVLQAGHLPINPLVLVKDPNAKWVPAMKICIKALMEVDAVLVLPCAENSKGATLEKELAAQLSIPMYASVENIFSKKKKTENKIYQYTKDGDLVKCWGSVREAVAAGHRKIGIYNCIAGRVKTCGGYIWSRKKIEIYV